MIGDRIKKVRGRRSAETLANLLGVHSQTLRRYEKGTRSPDAEFLIHFCTQLKINANWLLLGIGSMELGQAEEGVSFADSLARDLSEERQVNRELAKENRQLMKENRDLHVQLVEAKARAAPVRQVDPADQKSA